MSESKTIGTGNWFDEFEELSYMKEGPRKRLIESIKVLGGLAGEYTALYHVNLDTGEYIDYHLSEKTQDIRDYFELHPRFAELAHGFADSRLVHPDDREVLHSFYTTDEEVRESLNGKRKLSRLFRRNYGGIFLWTEANIIKIEDIDEAAHNIIVGFIEKDEEVREESVRLRRAGEAERKIANIVSNYNLSYTIDMTDDSFRVLRMDEFIIGQDRVFNCFSDVKAFFMEDVVHPSDRDLMLRELDFETIRSRLENTKSYTVEYRALIGDTTNYNEMHIASISDDEIVAGFALNDLDVVKRRLEEKRYEEYIALFLADTSTGMIKTIKHSPYFKTAEFGQSAPYSEGIRSFAELYEGEVHEFFLLLSDIDFVKRELSADNKRTYSYRATMLEGDKWIEVVSYVIQRNEDGSPAMFTVGFCMVDSLETARQELQERIKKSGDYQKLVDNLVSSYGMALTVNMEDDSCKLLKMDKTMIGHGMKFENFVEVREFFIGLLPYEDRDKMRMELDYSTIRRRLAENNSYDTEYIRMYNGESTWQLMNITAIDENSFAIGFADRDVEILKQHLEEKRYNEYFALFRADIDSRTVKIIKNEQKYTVVPVGRTVPYTEYFENMANAVDDEARAFLLLLSNIDYLARELAHEDKRFFTYKSERLQNNKWVDVTVYAIRRHEDGSPAMFTLGFSFADALSTERQELQAQIAEQQQQLAEALAMAESANKAKTTFLNSMSHDIRTPMNAIIGFTGLAASHIDNKEQVQDYLGKIAQSSNHLLSLINDVLDMSRIESGKMNLDEKPENLPDIIHTLRTIVMAEINAKQHDFFIDTVNVNDENIICDKLRLNQVLLNIISNAIKYTAQGGTISLRITEKTVKSSGYATYEFCIKDNGMGMDEEYLKTIFDPFTRVNSSTVSGIQGTGLGMAITKNIIDMMGGKIEVKSELSKGTEMTVTFDFKLQDEPKHAVSIPELEGLRALVADDDANTCVSIDSMLREIGMRTEWCTSGKEAVFRAQNAYRRGDLFKVYIIDWLMPDMNGIETTRRIRKVIGDDTPIIILTAYDWSAIEDEAREAGVTAFVSKPMFPSDLTRVLSDCLGYAEVKPLVVKPEYDFSGKRLLLVEDNELNREIAVEILGEAGFVIDIAEDGHIAVEKMKAAKPGDYDVILMDIQMPTMDGYEATKLIRAMGTEISRIPIIAMTANAFEEDRIAAIEAGMDEHVAKPIDIDGLKKTLAEFL